VEDNSHYVTRAELRAELEALEERLEQRLDQRFEGRMDAQEQRLKDYIREAYLESETRMLKAIYGYAATIERRYAQFEATDAALGGRVSTLESRMLECERRLNIPPAS
jgi:chromosome segregation ATPase